MVIIAMNISNEIAVDVVDINDNNWNNNSNKLN